MKKQIVEQLRDSARLTETLAAEESDTIAAMAEALIRCLRDGGCVYLAGNGGSAADAQHLAGELVGRFERERPGLAAVALTTDTSVLTSVANDYGYERVFARQVEALVGPGDVLVAFSTSGTSPNVVAAARLARERGAVVLAMSGRDGGELARHANWTLTIDSDRTCRIQEGHITAGHVLCDLVEQAMAEHAAEP